MNANDSMLWAGVDLFSVKPVALRAAVAVANRVETFDAVATGRSGSLGDDDAQSNGAARSLAQRG
jgi:hypothetical protein